MNIERPRSLKEWWLSGEPFVWLNAAAVSISIIAVVGLLLLLLVVTILHGISTIILVNTQI